MAETTIEEKAAPNKDQWRERIAEQERSGVSVRQFCQTHGIREHLFYKIVRSNVAQRADIV